VQVDHALASSARVTRDGRMVFLVPDPGEGRDLNGDGDLEDAVAFRVHLR